MNLDLRCARLGKLEEIRIRDLAGLFAQYRPYLMTAVAILLVVVALPLKKNLTVDDEPARAVNAPLVGQEQAVVEQPTAPVVEQPPPVEAAPVQAPFPQPTYDPNPPQQYVDPSQTGPPQPSPSPSPQLGCFPGLGCQ